jgi:hypothetical protein
MLDKKQELINRFKKFNKINPSNQESEFFSDFLLKYCPNFGIISDNDGHAEYINYFERKYDKVKAFPTCFRINLDYLAENPEQLIGIVKGEQLICYYFQPSPEVLLITYFTAISDDHYDVSGSLRILVGTFSYFDRKSLEKTLTDFKERGLILNMPDLKPSLVGANTGSGFGLR